MALTQYESLSLVAYFLAAAFAGLSVLVGVVGLVFVFYHYQASIEVAASKSEEFRATYVVRARRGGWRGWLAAMTAESLGWRVKVDLKSANVSLGTSDSLQKY